MLRTDPDQAQRFHDTRTWLSELSPSDAAPVLREMAQRVRRDDLEMVYRARLGHIGGDFSVIDILVTLYAAVLDVDPEQPLAAGRDRLVLSKGHTAGALYTTLAHCGFFARRELETFASPLSALNGHPNRTKVPGVETNTGPLGHGFPVAVGIALSARLQASPRRTFVVLGDGELQEGSNWEAAMTAAHYDLSSCARSSTGTGSSRARGPRRPSSWNPCPPSGPASAGRSARSTATITPSCSTRSGGRAPRARSA